MSEPGSAETEAGQCVEIVESAWLHPPDSRRLNPLRSHSVVTTKGRKRNGANEPPRRLRPPRPAPLSATIGSEGVTRCMITPSRITHGTAFPKSGPANPKGKPARDSASFGDSAQFVGKRSSPASHPSRTHAVGSIPTEIRTVPPPIPRDSRAGSVRPR